MLCFTSLQSSFHETESLLNASSLLSSELNDRVMYLPATILAELNWLQVCR